LAKEPDKLNAVRALDLGVADDQVTDLYLKVPVFRYVRESDSPSRPGAELNLRPESRAPAF
jgi:hypothetical protein